MKDCFKSVRIRPLTGVVDTRSAPEHIPFGGYRWTENASVTDKGKLCRAHGFGRLSSDIALKNNYDLHDQLGFNDDGIYDPNHAYLRQPINSIFQAVSTRGTAQLIVGTQNRIYTNNPTTGTWRVISDQYGGTPSVACGQPWRFAQQRNIVLITNGRDEPLYHVLGQPLIDGENADQGVDTIDSLQLIGLSKAQCVVSWRGFVLWGNVVMDGVRADDRIVWSDFDKPLSYKPAKSKSLAGFHDLGQGESILAMVPLGNILMVYTTIGIWEGQVVGGDEVIAFRQRYAEAEGGDACLAFPETVVSTGDEHLYFGRDGIYLNSSYLPKPERVEWMHLASGRIFEDIDANQCSVPCGGYDPAAKTIWWSWARNGEPCNQQTMRFNIRYPFADYLPIGFSAYANSQPDRPEQLRKFIVENCICTADELAALLSGVKTGGFCPGSEPTYEASCEFVPQSLYTSTGLDVGDGKTTEDFNRASPDADSLAALLGEMTVEDLCFSELSDDECNAEQRFVMACTVDHCLKETTQSNYHEICTSFTQCATYRLDGYDMILRSGPIDFNAPDDLKTMSRFMIEFIAGVQSTPSQLQLRIGASYQPADPNTGDCGIVWYVQPNKPLSCNTKTSAQHLADNTRPNIGTEWPVYRKGHYFYWEIKVSGTGGAACFSSVTMKVGIK